MGSSEEADARLARVLAIVEAQDAKLEALVARQPLLSSITLSALFDEWEKARGHEASWHRIRNRIRPLIRRHGSLPAAQLTELAWAKHRAARAVEAYNDDPESPKYPAPHTLTIEFQRTREMLKFAVRSRLLEHNPLSDAKIEKTISERETWFDETGLQQLLSGVPALKHERAELIMRAMILLCFDCMLRFNEARKLRRDRIREEVIALSAKVTKGKKARVVGITPRVEAAIAEVPPVLGDQRIFVNPATRDLYSETRLRDWFHEVCFASGINHLAADGEHVVFHTLRHSGASTLDAAGAHPTAIRDAMGHEHLSTTEKYLHRHRTAGARSLARLMAENAELQRKGPQRSTGGDSATKEPHATTFPSKSSRTGD